MLAENEEGADQSADRNDRHHQTQTGQGRGTLHNDITSRIAVALQADQIDTDTCQEDSQTGGSLDYQCLHREDYRLFTVAALQFAIVNGTGQEDSCQNCQDTIGKEYQHARNQQDRQAVGETCQAADQQQSVADDGTAQADFEDLCIAIFS